MADETLILLANEVRGKTLRLLQGVGDEQARWAPAGLANNVVWHAGHSLWVVEHLSVSPATGRPLQMPEGWVELFKAGSAPGASTSWPRIAEVAERLQEQLGRLTKAIEGLTPGRLAQVVDAGRNRTLRYVILHGLHDEAGHQGEIWLLKKMVTKGLR